MVSFSPKEKTEKSHGMCVSHRIMVLQAAVKRQMFDQGVTLVISKVSVPRKNNYQMTGQMRFVLDSLDPENS